MLPLEHSAILLTRILKAIHGLENQFLVFLRVAVLHPFHCIKSSLEWINNVFFSFSKPLLDSHQASLTWSIFKQSFLKQILTEGNYSRT